MPFQDSGLKMIPSHAKIEPDQKAKLLLEPIRQALKEWESAINALQAGDTILLLRKGGIREVGGKFRVKHRQILLYPTYEHQNPDLLKPDFASNVKVVASGWHPKTIVINGWAEITHIFALDEANKITALLPFLVWNERFIEERLRWKPQQPLYALCLRVSRLSKTFNIAFSKSYGGCQSWIEIQDPIPLQSSTLALTDEKYEEQVRMIQAIVH